MKEIIMTVLNRWKQRNIDFTSEKVRTELAEEIEIVLKEKNFNNAVFGDSDEVTTEPETAEDE